MTAPTPQADAARTDFDTIWNWCEDFARQALGKYGEFFPFAAYVQTDGEFHPIAVDLGQENAEPQKIIDALMTIGVEAAAKAQIRAFGLCFDSEVTLVGGRDTNAVICRLEHRKRAPVEVVMPYRLENGTAVCETPQAIRAEAKIFQGAPQ